MKNRHRPIRIISIVVILYMIFALSWWAILLSKKNAEVYDLQMSHINQTQLDISLEDINRRYDSQQKMIMGEGLFFGIALVLGIWLINRSYKQQIKVTTNQNNFLMAVTHELRSPLASSKLLLETFIKRDLDLNAIKELSRNGLVEMERLESNVEKILFTTKVDSDYTLFYEHIDMEPLVEKVIDNLSPQFPHHRISTKCDTSIYADRECIHSMVHNLVENSLKYSPKESEVRIETHQKNSTVTIAVYDQGMGIERAEREKVKQKFYRIGSEATRKSKGTGLGLYLVDKLVQTHNGILNISANQPKGTVISIELPQKRMES